MAVKDEKEVAYYLGESELKTLHRKLAQSLRDQLQIVDHISGLWVTIEPVDADQNWADARSRIAFAAGMECPEFTLRDRGGRVHVIPLQPYNDECELWASWFEEWKPLRRGQFELVSASWSFYRGPRYNEQKCQILRCDWDNPVHLNAKRARPHWHFEFGDDHASSEGGEQSKDPDSLQEIIEPGSPAASAVSGLAKHHFGMAGWNNKGPHPACWQADFDTSELTQWAIRVLHHVREEFGLT